MGPADKTVVVVKQKARHRGVQHGVSYGGYHGGAWKVAYADFMTAMMAFFMVMWILGMNQQLRNSIEGYFSNPGRFKKGYTEGSTPSAPDSSPAVARKPAADLAMRQLEEQEFRDMGERIQSRLKDAGLATAGDRIEIIQMSSGLRIELADGRQGADFFATASSTMSQSMHSALEIMGQELATLHNPVIIEGHTDAARYAGLYTNWELSADRANAARRVLEANGLSPDRVTEVRAMADRQLWNPENPLDPRNRRITIFLPFTTQRGDSTHETPAVGNLGM